MDIKKYLCDQIKICKRKMNLAKGIDCGIFFAAAGGIFGMFCELASLVWQFYYVQFAAGHCFAAGLLAGIVYALAGRADMKQAARRLDSFGLKERMITACEQLDKDGEFAQLQRQDAMVHYDEIRGRIKIPLWPDRRHILALLLSVALVTGLGFLPSAVREQARIHHKVQEQAKEEQEELEELLNALEGVDMDSLTEEQRAQLQEMSDAMALSKEELSGADSWESLASALERLDYKYGQTAQGLENLAGQLSNPDAAGIAGAEALAKAIANQNGQQLASAGTPGAGSGGESSDGDGNSDGESADGNNGGQNGDGDGQDGQNGSGQGQNGQNGSDGNGQGQNGSDGNGQGQNGNGNGNGQGNGNGNGQGNGSGNGQGNGNGNGQGNGNGTGTGGGRGTGSSDAAHDYVSIPNSVGDDPSLTGNKTGDQQSDYFRQQNGLAWEGEHVDYNSVIGRYTDSAYEGIANGKYPTGMESVIRDYFENLNK